MKKAIPALSFLLLILFSCSKKTNMPPPGSGSPFFIKSFTVNGESNGNKYYNLNTTPVVKISFSGGLIDKGSVNNGISISSSTGHVVAASFTYDNDSTLNVMPAVPFSPLTGYTLQVTKAVQSQQDSLLQSGLQLILVTSIDSTDKFPQIADTALLTLVQQQTFKYFYDFGHPVSGLARERNTSADVVTTGGSGFGVMALVVGVQRNFITRAQGLARMNLIVDFLTNKAQRYHGAFPHWMNGATGATVPFSAQDDGADLVETSFMMQGLLTARQFFNTGDPDEITLRNNINNLWNGVQWNWFRQNGQNALFWHWSPNFNFVINQQISGWDEAMVVYALAASSPVDSNRIPKIVYDNGWALNGNIKNGGSFYGITLPLGPDFGGPLFFAHYSFLGINPTNLMDTYANYWTQNQNHSLINYNYCVANPQKYNGYSSACWGLTASDDNLTGYSAHSPTNDLGIITPTAAISSLPYTPAESINALRFFYYKLGDKIWGQYGFQDAFNLTNVWFSNSYLAIDQGPEIIMIENYRTGLLWNLFMSSPEIKTGMKSLGFQSPNLN
jgi:hypothetical protein